MTATIPPAVAALSLGSLLLWASPLHAGTITGIASVPLLVALPRDAVFEAVLIDAALADAPARELGRVRLQPAGQAPFRFSIPYRDSEITPGGRYAVRATLRQGDRLLFTTDTETPVLSGGPSGPLRLKLVQVADVHFVGG